MPEYLSPGVYVEEIEIGAKPIEGVSTSTAGFLGETERGPTRPTLVTSFEQFNRLYGGYIDASFLAFAVEGFFRNGGQRCFVVRIVREQDANTAQKATAVTLPISSSLSIRAIGPGSWGTRIAVKIEDATLKSPDRPLFKLTVMYWSKTAPPQPVVDPTQRDKLRDPNRRDPTVLEVPY